MATHGSMKVEFSKGPAIVGTGNLSSDNSGQVWFDYGGRPYPSSIDWKSATTLTFTPDLGREKTWAASDVEYFFQGGWVGPRLVLQRG